MFLFKYFREIYNYKDFYFFLSHRNIKSLYSQTKLGLFWGVVNPLITSFAFTIVGMVLKVSDDILTHFLFTYTAVLPWILFRDIILNTNESFFKDANLIKKVKFPRIILPLSGITSKLIDFIVGLVVLILISFLLNKGLNVAIFLIPLLVLIIILSSVSIGLLLIIPSITYRDIRYVVKFIVPLIMFISPVLFTSNAVNSDWYFIYSLNPLVGVIEAFRAIFSNTEIPWFLIFTGSMSAIILFIFSLFVFVKRENTLTDYL